MGTKDKIKSTGTCHCGKVKWSVEGEIEWIELCHCLNCTRNRGAGPIHLLAVTPASGVVVTEGHEFVLTHGTEVSRCFCSTCGSLVHQGPVGENFRAIAPMNLLVDGIHPRPLPKEWWPKVHSNYENRLFDWADSLPKYKVFADGPQMENDGTIKEADLRTDGTGPGGYNMSTKERIESTGTCHCGKVKWSVEGEVEWIVLCHCLNCTRNRGAGPMHILAVSPASGVVVTEGHEFVRTHGTEVSRCFCSTCGSLVHQGPVGGNFRAIAPMNLLVDGIHPRPLPKEWWPKAHTNYENRLFDWADSLPKYKAFGGGPHMENDGTIIEAEA